MMPEQRVDSSRSVVQLDSSMIRMSVQKNLSSAAFLIQIFKQKRPAMETA